LLVEGDYWEGEEEGDFDWKTGSWRNWEAFSWRMEAIGVNGRVDRNWYWI
jgi:hypothetical protein